MKPRSITDLVGKGVYDRVIAFDPGKTVGLATYGPPASDDVWHYAVSSIPLDDFDHLLHSHLRPGIIVAEAFSLTGGNRRNDPSMPAPIALGMLRQAAHSIGCHVYLIQRTAKRAGQMALDTDGQAARAAAKNDHQRDAMDLLGFALRELRRPRPTKRGR